MMYNNYDDLLERFAVMTIDGHISETDAFIYLQDKTTPELLMKLKAESVKQFNQSLNSMINYYNDFTAKGKNGDDLLNSWKTSTPADLYNTLLKRLNKTPAGNETRPETSSGDALKDYVINKIGLYPCSNNVHPLCKIYDESKKIIESNIIKDVETLHGWKQKNISIFAFYPQHNNLIVLDLDNSDEHANKTNGIKKFLELIAGVEMPEQYKNYFNDFPHNFPCYVETPHNGIHLYFNASYIPQNWTPNKDELNKMNIEIKYNTQVTAGGSIRDGKQYILRGKLQNAPRINTVLINLLTKGRPAPIKKPAGSYKKKDGEQWKLTPDGIINKAQELYSNLGNHDFIYKTAVLFKNADFSKGIATEYIQQMPQHLGRKDQADTISIINYIFKDGEK